MPTDDAEQRASATTTLTRWLGSPVLGWIAVAVGAGLRIAQYAFNRSLWLDESFLALNIIERSFSGLLAPLSHDQAAPVGFLWIVKLVEEVFGTNELALRLIPLLAGVASVVLLLFVARRVLARELVATAVLLFGVLDRPIYFASEVKQYSSDVAIALALVLLGLEIERVELTRWRLAGLAAAGAIAVWLSHPAVFVLAGMGASLGIAAVVARRWDRLWRLGVAGATWVASFVAVYAVSLGAIAQNQKHQRYWSAAFMPLSPAEIGPWLWSSFQSIFLNPGGTTPVKLALACAVIGSAYLVVTARVQAAILLSPIVVCLAASALRRYPFGNRLVLFLVPMFVILIVKGVEAVARIRWPLGPVGAAILAIAVLAQPTLAAARSLRHPRVHEELKPVLAFVRDRRQPGDAIYLYYASRFPVLYYRDRYGFAEGDYVQGRIARRDPTQYRNQLEALRGQPRVWIILSHATQKRGIDEERYILDYLDSIGTKLDGIEEPDAAAFLYDLRVR